jgi:hypothetical protein
VLDEHLLHHGRAAALMIDQAGEKAQA